MRKEDIPSLTGLRFIAAASIVLDHLWPVIFKFDRLAALNDAMHQLAYLGMTLFFVLSGFIIHHNYSDSVSSLRGLRRFFVARFSRLYPLYLLVLVIDFILVRPPLDWTMLRMLTMTQSWSYELPGGHFLALGYHYSVVAWSISTEVFFYLVYPVVAAGLRRVSASAAVIACAPVCAAMLWWCNAHPIGFDTQGWFTYMAPYTRVLEFIAGCTIANFVRAPRWFPARAAAALSVVWIGLFLMRGFVGAEWLSEEMLEVGLLMPVALLIFSIARYDAIPSLGGRFVVRMGNASYSIYLLHLIVAEYVAFSAPLTDTHDNWVNAWARLVLALLVIGAGSRFSYRYFEEPARIWLRNRLSSSAPAGIEDSRSPSQYSS